MTAFARVTDEHDLWTVYVSPCAGFLYRFLLRLRPAGQAIEFEFEDFNQHITRTHRRPFSQKWIQTAIAQLEEIGLIQVLKKFNSHCLKLVAVHPSFFKEEKAAELAQKPCPYSKETSQKEASNPHSAVPIHRENVENNKQPVVVGEFFSTNIEGTTKADILELTNLEIVADSDHSMASFEKICKSDDSLAILEFVEENHNSVGSLEIVGESQAFEVAALDNPTDMGEEEFSAPRQKDSPELLAKAEEVGVILNPYVMGLIAKAEAEVVKNAIAALKEAKRKGTVKNPTGYLVKAIQQKWQPMEAKDPQNGLPHGFGDWYQKVIDLGLVENLPPNYLSSDRNGEPFVRVRVPNGNCPYTLTPWREAMVLLQT